jgi:hypothetical protein
VALQVVPDRHGWLVVAEDYGRKGETRSSAANCRDESVPACRIELCRT